MLNSTTLYSHTAPLEISLPSLLPSFRGNAVIDGADRRNFCSNYIGSHHHHLQTTHRFPFSDFKNVSQQKSVKTEAIRRLSG